MSDINMPIDMFYDEEDEGVRKICVKIEIESKFPKLMKLRGDFSEFRDLGIEHPIHHDFGKMLESLPTRTLELLYEEVKEEMVNAAEKKMKVEKFKKSISSIRENLKKYQLLMSQRLTLIEMRFETDTKRKERVKNEEEIEKLSSRFEELFGPSKLKKRLTEEKFEDAKEEIIEKPDEKPEVREDDIEVLEQKEYEIERGSNAVSLTKSQIEQIPEVIPDVGLELAKLIELPKEILIWTRLVNDNYRTCRVHINPQFIGNAIGKNPIEYNWIPEPHDIKTKQEPMKPMVSLLDKEEFSLRRVTEKISFEMFFKSRKNPSVIEVSAFVVPKGHTPAFALERIELGCKWCWETIYRVDMNEGTIYLKDYKGEIFDVPFELKFSNN